MNQNISQTMNQMNQNIIQTINQMNQNINQIAKEIGTQMGKEITNKFTDISQKSLTFRKKLIQTHQVDL